MTSYELQVWLWLFLESNIMKKCPDKGSWNLSNLLPSFTCLVTRSTFRPLVALICPLVILIYSLLVFICLLLVLVCLFVCLFAVLVSPLMVFICLLALLVWPLVCPLVLFIVLSVGLFITDPVKNVISY